MALEGQLCRMQYLAKVPQFHVRVRIRVHVYVCVLSVSVSVSMSISISMSGFRFHVHFMLFKFKYGAMNICGRMAIILSNSKGPRRWA
jgi:hypothetical protein